jgi:hypothetical protein
MTASDLPTVTGIPNNGGEGYRFLGYPAYDGVVNWDYSHMDQTSDGVPGQYAELSRNESYWNKARIPKLDRLVVYPMPEATTRVAALRSGQVDWIEIPPPDAIPSLRAAGFQISLWP